MRTIIVSTDFSPVSLNAIDFAAAMALDLGAELHLFHACHIPFSYADPMVMISNEYLQGSAEMQLEVLRQSVVKQTGGELTVTSETGIGDTIDVLVTICKRVQPFAVVMGAKAKTGLEKIVLGSTTLSAIRQLQWPVLCIPPGRKYNAGIRRIGFACDFQEVVTTTPVNYIKQLVDDFRAELHIMNVDYRQNHSEVADETHRLRAIFHNQHPEFHFISHPDIEDGINEFAERLELDILIAVPKKHTLLDTIFRKSTTRQLIFQSHVPLLCMH
jgi:nucleotide-binding universal stress UspA family protein